MEIRPATPADAAELAQLRYVFRAEHGPPTESETAFVARATAWFAQRLGTPVWRGWVAVDPSGAIVGHLFLYYLEKVPNPLVEPELIGYVTNFYVVPEQRNAGLGRRLLAALLAECPADRVHTIVVWPTARSRPLYLRSGFQVPEKLLERTPDALQ